MGRLPQGVRAYRYRHGIVVSGTPSQQGVQRIPTMHSTDGERQQDQQRGGDTSGCPKGKGTPPNLQHTPKIQKPLEVPQQGQWTRGERPCVAAPHEGGTPRTPKLGNIRNRLEGLYTCQPGHGDGRGGRQEPKRASQHLAGAAQRRKAAVKAWRSWWRRETPSPHSATPSTATSTPGGATPKGKGHHPAAQRHEREVGTRAEVGDSGHSNPQLHPPVPAIGGHQGKRRSPEKGARLRDGRPRTRPAQPRGRRRRAQRKWGLPKKQRKGDKGERIATKLTAEKKNQG